MIELAHAVFYVRDLRQSLEFYQGVVGLARVGLILNGGGPGTSGW